MHSPSSNQHIPCISKHFYIGYMKMNNMGSVVCLQLLKFSSSECTKHFIKFFQRRTKPKVDETIFIDTMSFHGYQWLCKMATERLVNWTIQNLHVTYTHTYISAAIACQSPTPPRPDSQVLSRCAIVTYQRFTFLLLPSRSIVIQFVCRFTEQLEAQGFLFYRLNSHPSQDISIK